MITNFFKLVIMKKMVKRIIWFLFLLISLASCDRLQTIPHEEYTPQNWCTEHPCVTVPIGAHDIVISEPSSSFLIYFLGFLTLAIAFYLYRKHAAQFSRKWFSFALLFWGLAAILAGTSYQAFGYEIKCAGKPFCSWTSWWEIFYYFFQSLSMNSFLVAISYSSVKAENRRYLFGYALLNLLVYQTLLFTGAFLPSKFLISFELFTLMNAPSFLILFIINLKNYRRTQAMLDWRLLWLWALQGIIIVVYFAYLFSGIQQMLWQKNIWFTANDVLHILIILWQLYIYFYVIKHIKDKVD